MPSGCKARRAISASNSACVLPVSALERACVSMRPTTGGTVRPSSRTASAASNRSARAISKSAVQPPGVNVNA